MLAGLNAWILRTGIITVADMPIYYYPATYLLHKICRVIHKSILTLCHLKRETKNFMLRQNLRNYQHFSQIKRLFIVKMKGVLCTCCLGKTRTLTNGTRIRCATITPQGNFFGGSIAALSLRFRFDTAKLVLFCESTKFFQNFFQKKYHYFLIYLFFSYFLKPFFIRK